MLFICVRLKQHINHCHSLTQIINIYWFFHNIKIHIRSTVGLLSYTYNLTILRHTVNTHNLVSLCDHALFSHLFVNFFSVLNQLFAYESNTIFVHYFISKMRKIHKKNQHKPAGGLQMQWWKQQQEKTKTKTNTAKELGRNSKHFRIILHKKSLQGVLNSAHNFYSSRWKYLK